MKPWRKNFCYLNYGTIRTETCWFTLNLRSTKGNMVKVIISLATKCWRFLVQETTLREWVNVMMRVRELRIEWELISCFLRKTKPFMIFTFLVFWFYKSTLHVFKFVSSSSFFIPYVVVQLLHLCFIFLFIPHFFIFFFCDHKKTL